MLAKSTQAHFIGICELYVKLSYKTNLGNKMQQLFSLFAYICVNFLWGIFLIDCLAYDQIRYDIKRLDVI